jgi:DNA-binding response OmpR family regulator
VEQGSAEQNASPPAVPQILFLPLTWKDISVLMPAGDRNTEFFPNADGVRFGEVHVDFYRMQVTRRGKAVELTAQEFKVLKFMVLNPNRAISRDELLNQAWGYDSYPCTRTVDSHVWRLRRKLEADPSNPLHFRTMSRVGYKFVP